MKVYHSKLFGLDNLTSLHYFASDVDFFRSDDWISFFKEKFELVAEVETENLEIAFELTNSIDSNWWDNDDVKCIARSRSTSIGDIIEDNRGNLFLCDFIGWRQLTFQ